MTMPRTLTLLSGSLCLFCFLLSGAAQAQLAPPPQKAPRTPVKRESLSSNKAPLPASRIVEGAATVLDSERLKIDDVEMRLFGVVPPQLSASFGPQARAVIDALAAGAVTCRIRDRDRDGRFLASCQNGNEADFGIELLRRGLAVTARGTLRSSELSRPYIAAEEAAKAGRLGLWSVALPKAVSEKDIREAAQKSETESAEKRKQEEAAKESSLKKEAPKADSKPPEEKPVEEKTPEPQLSTSQPTVVASPSPDVSEKNKISLSPTAEELQALLNTSPILATEIEEKGFLEKYQLMIVGLLALLTALAWATASALFRSREKRDELRAIAAALRGEMMAARAICLARLSKMANEKDEKATSWPRIRSLVFQAYVGQLGRLGAELSRQIASIYGQASDYASYYVGADSRPEVASKRQSLQTLVQHIEEVVPRLNEIEQKGAVLNPPQNEPLTTSLLARVVRPTFLAAPSSPPDDDGSGRPATLPAPEETTKEPEKKGEPTAELDKAKTEIAAEVVKPKEKAVETKTTEPPNAQQKDPPQHRPKAMPSSQTRTTVMKAKKKPASPPRLAQIEETMAFMAETLKKLDVKTPLREGLGKLKTLSTVYWQRLQPQQPYEDVIPDYANLTDEELEALSYADEDPFLPPETKQRRRTG